MTFLTRLNVASNLPNDRPGWAGTRAKQERSELGRMTKHQAWHCGRYPRCRGQFVSHEGTHSGETNQPREKLRGNGDTVRGGVGVASVVRPCKDGLAILARCALPTASCC